MGTLSLLLQGAIIGIAAIIGAFIRFSTIALFSVLHKAITALLASHQVLHVGHVEETHAPSLLEVAIQVTFAAATEDAWERMPSGGSHHTASLLGGGLHTAAIVVMAHTEVVADLMGHGGRSTNGQL